MVIPKPGTPDYSMVPAYRVVSLLDVISKLVERTAACRIADHLERRKGKRPARWPVWMPEVKALCGCGGGPDEPH